MPINYKKYPPTWKTVIRPRILARAKNQCEHCGVENHAVGFRDKSGKFHVLENTIQNSVWADENGIRVFKIVLTIAHLDHDEENWDVKDDRLAALCQKCHNNYDADERKRRKEAKKNKNQMKLF